MNATTTSDQLPPHDEKAEKGILGCVILEPENAGPILEQCEPEDFYQLKHREIFETARVLYENKRLRFSSDLTQSLKDSGRLDAVGGLAYVDKELPDSTPSAVAFDIFLPRLKDCSLRRQKIQHCKRVIDWAMDRNSDMALLPEFQLQAPAIIQTRAWVDLPEWPDDHPSILIGPGRWSSKGGGTLWVSCTGAGKSTLASTCAHSFAIGRECLGFVPRRPLKSTMIQAEDDDGDLAEMTAGIQYALKPTEQEMEMMRQNVRIITENSLTGVSFLHKVVRPILRQDKPDLLWINPLNAYLGADTKDMQKVAEWFRNNLNPLLHEAGCHAHIIHHTPKPTKDNKGYSALDIAYSGSGSADLANWAREVVVLQQRGPGLFEMLCVKRGARLGWKDADGNTTRSRHIAYGEAGKQYWRLATEADIEQAGVKRYSDAALLELIPITGIDKAHLVEAVMEAFAVSDKPARNYLKDLARTKMRQFEAGRFRCALIKETKRPRGDVYPGESGRQVVWITKLSHFEKQQAA